MKCVDCGNQCRNRCSGCGRPYCSYCRDQSGYRTCFKYCRAPKAAKAQQSKSARATVQQRAASAQAAHTPPPALAQFAQPAPGVQGATPPPMQGAKRAQRKMLFLMDEQEFRAWKDATIAALEDAQARTTAYLARRAQRGTQASTDFALQRDLAMYADLLEALEEIETLWEWAQVEQKLQSGAQLTEIELQPYDKLQP